MLAQQDVVILGNAIYLLQERGALAYVLRITRAAGRVQEQTRHL